MELSYSTHTLEFLKPAKTSRGEYATKNVTLVTLQQDGFSGTGEASPLPDLSPDGQLNLLAKLDQLSEVFKHGISVFEVIESLEDYPSLQFALECAYRQIQTKSRVLYESDFTRGTAGISINGLVWMSSVKDMEQEALTKIQNGMYCMKFKVGSQNHDQECRMLERIRKSYSAFKVEIRLDANGAYSFEDVPQILKDFKRFDVHSIEQPIRAGQWEEMGEICAKSPIAIALDEELIGFKKPDISKLLQTIKPQYIILKPTLLGGFTLCELWIAEAQKRNIGWWATSALESNIGLGHIAQWVAKQNNPMPQGLGTGLLYANNFPADTELRGSTLWYKTESR